MPPTKCGRGADAPDGIAAIEEREGKRRRLFHAARPGAARLPTRRRTKSCPATDDRFPSNCGRSRSALPMRDNTCPRMSTCGTPERFSNLVTARGRCDLRQTPRREVTSAFRPEARQRTRLRSVGREDFLFSLRENAIAKEPGRAILGAGGVCLDSVLQWWLRLHRVFPVEDCEPGSVFGPITGDPDPVTPSRGRVVPACNRDLLPADSPAHRLGA